MDCAGETWLKLQFNTKHCSRGETWRISGRQVPIQRFQLASCNTKMEVEHKHTYWQIVFECCSCFVLLLWTPNQWAQSPEEAPDSFQAWHCLVLEALFLCEAPREKHFQSLSLCHSMSWVQESLQWQSVSQPGCQWRKLPKKIRILCCLKDTKLKKALRPCPQAIEDLDFQLFRQSGPSSWRNVINHLLKGNGDC